jgi:hypothetical protein
MRLSATSEAAAVERVGVAEGDRLPPIDARRFVAGAEVDLGPAEADTDTDRSRVLSRPAPTVRDRLVVDGDEQSFALETIVEVVDTLSQQLIKVSHALARETRTSAGLRRRLQAPAQREG